MKYNSYHEIVESIFSAYIHCARQAGAIRTQRMQDSVFAEDEELASGQPKIVQFRDKSLPRVDPFRAKEFIADADAIFDKVLENRPQLDDVLDTWLREIAGLPHESFESKKREERILQTKLRSGLALHIGRLAARRDFNPSTYFLFKRLRAAR